MKIVFSVAILLLCFSIYLYAKVGANKKKRQSDFKNHPQLGVDLVKSMNYELVKMFELGENNITDKVYYLPDEQIVVFNAGICSYLRIDSTGKLLSSFSNSSPIHKSGIFFHHDYYVDWALTGDSSKKQYKKRIPGDTLSKEQFGKYYNQAEVVACKNRFQYDPDISFVSCIMKIEGEWIIIENTIIDANKTGDFFKELRENIMHGYETKNENPLITIENTIIPFYNWKDTSNPIYIETHQRRIKIKKPFLSYDINNTRRRNGWEATGYFNLKIEQDTLKFKAYTYEMTEDRNDFNPKMSWYSVPSNPQLTYLLVEAGRGDRNPEEIGLYVLKKIGVE